MRVLYGSALLKHTTNEGNTMAHELDITNGVASFADSRNDAWHGLGQQVGHTMTAAEVLEEAHLGRWNVRKTPLVTPGDDEFPIAIPDKFATVRTNPITGRTEYLGVVGKNYEIVQNEDTVEFLDALVDESGAHFETAGALRDGREIFVTMKLPGHMEFTLPNGMVDKTDLYLAGMNSHDGYGAFKVLVTHVRVVCGNTQSAAIASAKSMWSRRHTLNALNSLEEARQTLSLAFTYNDAFSRAVEAMIDATVEEDIAEQLIRSVFQVDEAPTERARDLRESHATATLQGLALPTCDGIRDTQYGLYNAVTEYIDHRIEIKDAKGVAPEKQLFGAYADIKSRAFGLLVPAGVL